jgi:hypothetical protein
LIGLLPNALSRPTLGCWECLVVVVMHLVQAKTKQFLSWESWLMHSYCPNDLILNWKIQRHRFPCL